MLLQWSDLTKVCQTVKIMFERKLFPLKKLWILGKGIQNESQKNYSWITYGQVTIKVWGEVTKIGGNFALKLFENIFKFLLH